MFWVGFICGFLAAVAFVVILVVGSEIADRKL